MGKLIFVNTNRIYGIWGVILCSAMIFGGAYGVIHGSYIYIFVALFGAVCSKVCLKIASQRTEVYEQGFVMKNLFEQVSGRYADQKSLVRAAFVRNGVMTTQVIFITPSGKRVLVSDETLRRNDKKMDQLMDLACNAIAEKWAKTLEHQSDVVWIENGTAPLIKIRKDGLVVSEKTGAESFLPLNQVRYKQAFGLKLDILNGDRKVLTVDTNAHNFFVGQTLIAMLLKRQSQAFAAGKA
jgi:hypothetical protein